MRYRISCDRCRVWVRDGLGGILEAESLQDVQGDIEARDWIWSDDGVVLCEDCQVGL